MKNRIIYDYLTFTSKVHHVYSMIDILGLQNVTFENLKGFYGYRDRLYYDGISIHYNGCDNMGICVEMSGKGCRTWEKCGNSDYDAIFDLILFHYNDDVEKREMKITRLDVAYDDFNGVLDLPLLCSETQKGNYSSRFKDWQVIFGNKGISVCHGSNKSNVYVRIYDKRLEQRAEDKFKHWVRCELQIRHECALGFIQLKDTIENKYFQVLNNYLRYVVPTQNVSNCRVLDTAPYWLAFIESASSASIFCKPAFNYNIDSLYGFVNNQISASINTYISIFGVEQFLVDINNSQKGKKLNPKYQSLKEQYNANSDAIIDFLNERDSNNERA